MNSKRGKWGREIRASWPKGLKLNTIWAIVVTITPKYFSISVNNVALSKTFSHRFPIFRVTGVQHTGGKVKTAVHRQTREIRNGTQTREQ